jgi:hypothetical protein
MTTGNNNNESANVVSDYYEGYTNVQKDVLAIELHKTRNMLLILAAIVFAADLIVLVATNTVMPATILIIAIVPIILTGLAFLATKEPLAAMIIAAVIIVGIWIYNIAVTGGRAAIAGWLIKALLAYLIFAGFQHAREATKIKKELA